MQSFGIVVIWFLLLYLGLGWQAQLFPSSFYEGTSILAVLIAHPWTFTRTIYLVSPVSSTTKIGSESRARSPLCNSPLQPSRVTLASMSVTEAHAAARAEMNGAAIRTDRVSRHYQMGDALIRAVNQISLEIRTEEFLALLGASGSGKSTLLNLIAGLDRPTSGAIFAKGRDLAALSSEELAGYRNHTVGMVFQSFQLLPRMTLEENVELPLRLAEVPRNERPARVREALERVGLEARVKHRPAELSGGEQQRAAIARALVNQPLILLADEPTGNLDSKTGEEIMNLLAEIHRPPSGPDCTIVLVTHERPLADRYADRIITLSDGAVAREERLR